MSAHRGDGVGTMAVVKPLFYSDCVKLDKVCQGSKDPLGGSSSSLDYWDKTCRKIRRFYHRYFIGVEVGGWIRLLTLTSSNEAVEKELDINRNFSALVKRLRRHFGRFEYIKVKEEKKNRVHIHVVFRGEYMEQAFISDVWSKLHHSPVIDIRRVRGARGGARYLAKYLVKGNNRYHASYNWVFPGWVSWSQRVKRWVGHYPSKSILRVLAQVDPQRRVELQWFLCPVAMMPP